MLANVLVVDQTEEFGALIRNTLEESGQYQVSLAMSADQAIAIGEEGGLHLLIIDFDLADFDAASCIQRFRTANPRIAIIAIPPNIQVLESLWTFAVLCTGRILIMKLLS